MKMGNTRSPSRYDIGAGVAPQSPKMRRPAIPCYALLPIAISWMTTEAASTLSYRGRAARRSWRAPPALSFSFLFGTVIWPVGVAYLADCCRTQDVSHGFVGGAGFDAAVPSHGAPRILHAPQLVELDVIDATDRVGVRTTGSNGIVWCSTISIVVRGCEVNWPWCGGHCDRPSD
jgi:hypothetical protein